MAVIQMKTLTHLPYEEFRARLCKEMAGPAGKLTAWMVDVGYRPSDKDMGHSRWQEIYAPATSGSEVAEDTNLTQCCFLFESI